MARPTSQSLNPNNLDTNVQRTTPNDPDEMNDKRADAAKRALLSFAQDFGERDERGEVGIFAEQNLTDLLIDLAHYCDREGLAMHECLLRARRVYAEETDESGRQFMIC
jgi:hypothetical protein